MDDKGRWAILEQVFHGALALEPGQRPDYIRKVCGEDEELRRRIQSLLARDDSSLTVDSEAWADATMPHIGPYRVLSKLGSGGMGNVYLAIDSRLDRKIALKVLPPQFVTDSERKDRFLREAKAASALNHPNIVAVHEFSSDGELDYLVMEFVPGKPLDRLIPRDGLKLREALGYAIQIAEALACAHAAGIIHRDLKPGNVIVTETGVAKVLDFGLAKFTSGAVLTTQTGRGMILGTVAYMSPEQATGVPVDPRSDIFSFGLLLYEMTTGRRAFQRDSTAATLAAIANDEPPAADKIAQDVPRAVAAIIERCMRKDSSKRFGSAVELKSALAAIRDTPAAKKWTRWIGLGAVTLGFGMAGTGLFWSLNSTHHVQEPSRVLAAVPLTTYPFLETSPTFSPDGSQVAFVWQGPKGDNSDIYIKVVGEDEPVRLTRDPLRDDAPAWSPDGRWIAFLRHLNRIAFLEQRPDEQSAVFVIPATGGPERRIATIYSPAGFLPRICWDSSSRWLVVPDKTSPYDSESLYLLSARDGEKRRLTSPVGNIVGDEDPSFSPDGQSIAFSRAITNDTRDIYVIRLADNLTPTGEPVRVTFDGRFTLSPAWTSDGRSVVYASGTFHNPRLWRTWLPQPGMPPKPPELLAFAGWGARTPTISRNGRLAFTTAQKDADIQRLELTDSAVAPHASKPPVTAISSTRIDHTPWYSPDGSRVAFASDRSGNHEIWVCDRDGSNAMPLTSFNGPYTADPFWSPDGSWIAFGSSPEGLQATYLVSPSGGASKRLTGAEIEAAPAGWSRDHKWLYISSRPAGNRITERRIWKISPDGRALVPVTRGPGLGRAIESPDARFLYYLQDDESIGSLWRMPLPSGEPEKILDAVFGLNFDITDNGVFFIASESQASIQFLRFVDRKVITIAQLGSSTLAFGMSLAPDHRSLLFSVFVMHPIDLMIVENFR
ncbi:MAG: protein kinase [Bryobacteraceae bacterium]